MYILEGLVEKDVLHIVHLASTCRSLYYIPCLRKNSLARKCTTIVAVESIFEPFSMLGNAVFHTEGGEPTSSSSRPPPLKLCRLSHLLYYNNILLLHPTSIRSPSWLTKETYTV